MAPRRPGNANDAWLQFAIDRFAPAGRD